MKAVIQRVKYSNVKIDGEIVGKCENGFMILLGVWQGDTKADADKLVKKIPNLRIFEDENGKMNLSCLDIGGEILVISQFTLCADCSHAGDRLLQIPHRPTRQTRFMNTSFPSLKTRVSKAFKRADSAPICRLSLSMTDLLQ